MQKRPFEISVELPGAIILLKKKSVLYLKVFEAGGEDSIAELCRREDGAATGLPTRWCLPRRDGLLGEPGRQVASISQPGFISHGSIRRRCILLLLFQGLYRLLEPGFQFGIVQRPQCPQRGERIR